MKKILLLSAIVLFAVSCGENKTTDDFGGGKLSAVEKTSAQIAGNIERLIANDSTKSRSFAVRKDKSVIEYKGSDPLPDDVEETCTLTTDLKGKPLRITVTPVIDSDAWYVENYYYFNVSGNTVLYRFYLASFESGCTEVLREYKDFYFDDNFNQTGRQEYYKDKDMKPFTPKDCKNDFSYVTNYEGMNNFTSIAAKYGIKL